ncbi:MAG: flagellar hook capping FlgD N-terminal domain-containing protein [Phycisphaerales bacterium]
MSTVDAVSSSSSTVTTTTSGFGALGTEDFLNIMLSELQAQDPLEPQDSQALLQQFSSLYQIESSTRTSASLESLVSQNEFASAAILIGSLVSGISTDNQRVADIVLSVSNTADGPILNLLDGSQVLFSNVDEVAAGVTLGDDDSDTTGDDDTGTIGEDDDTGDDDSTTTPTASVSASGSSSAGEASASGSEDSVDKVVAALKELLG